MASILGTSVQLYVYDLSQGMARALSGSLLGIQLDAIYHTGVVIDGTEYYFGQGIQQDPAGRTPFGQPMQIIDLGRTEIPPEIREDFMLELAEKYRPNTYSLLKNNCNHFSNELAQLLTGNGIPEYIVSLPDRVLSTPMGMMFAPMLSTMEERTKALSAQGHAFQPRYHSPVEVASVAQVLADTPGPATHGPSAQGTAGPLPGSQAGPSSFTEVVQRQQRQRQQLHTESAVTTSQVSEVQAAEQQDCVNDGGQGSEKGIITAAGAPAAAQSEQRSSSTLAATAHQQASNAAEAPAHASTADTGDKTSASAAAADRTREDTTSIAAASTLFKTRDSTAASDRKAAHGKLQDKAAFEAAVREQFAALMAAGGRTANEAAALAVQQALAKVKVQA